jgi:hypothetical protein
MRLGHGAAIQIALCVVLGFWLGYPASPRTNASDLFTLTIDASSRWPKAAPILSAFTVMGLSSMICDAMRNPFSGDGSTVGRNSGASTSVDVMGKITTDPRPANWSA